MKKAFLVIGLCLAIGLVFSPSIWAKTIKIGINAPLTGDNPKVGEGTKYAAEMWLEDIKKAGGLKLAMVVILKKTCNYQES